MMPGLYIRPDVRSLDGTGEAGESDKIFSPRLLNYPWSMNIVPVDTGALFWLADAEFPLSDNKIPDAVWDCLNVSMWRLTGTFDDVGYDPMDDEPDRSRTISFLIQPGLSYEEQTIEGNFSSTTNGAGWTTVEEAVRGNGRVSNVGSLALAACYGARLLESTYVDEDDVSSYYYHELRAAIGQPVLYLPLADAVPTGATIDTWCWVLPVNGIPGGGTFFAEASGANGEGKIISFNGVDAGDLDHSPDTWTITLAKESYYT